MRLHSFGVHFCRLIDLTETSNSVIMQSGRSNPFGYAGILHHYPDAAGTEEIKAIKIFVRKSLYFAGENLTESTCCSLASLSIIVCVPPSFD